MPTKTGFKLRLLDWAALGMDSMTNKHFCYSLNDDSEEQTALLVNRVTITGFKLWLRNWAWTQKHCYSTNLQMQQYKASVKGSDITDNCNSALGH